jgi:hypothetical protein
VGIVALLFSCSSKPEDTIVGKWEEMGGLGALVMEVSILGGELTLTLPNGKVKYSKLK